LYISTNILKLLESIIYCGIKSLKKEVNGKNFKDFDKVISKLPNFELP